MKGLSRVRAFEHRRGIYYIEWYEDGRRVRERVSPSTQQAARQRAEEKAAEFEEGRGFTLTLGRLLAAFHQANKWSKEHRRHYETYRQFWLDRLGYDWEVNGRTLTPALVEQHVLTAGEERGWQGRTVETHAKYLRAAVRWAYRKARLIDRDLLDGITYPKYDSAGEAYTVEELNAISRVATQVDARFAGVWEILRDTGRRLNAVRLLKWEHLDLNSGTIRFPADTDKARKRAVAFLDQETVRILETVRDGIGNPWVFPGKHCPVGAGTLTRMLREAERRAEVEYIRGRGFHAVKRRVVTELMRGGMSADEVGQVTGNVEARVLYQTYQQVEDGVRRRAIELLTDTRTDNRSS